MTYHPLPEISLIFKSIFAKPIQNFELSPLLVKSEGSDELHLFSKTSWALFFVVQARILLNRESVNIWVPDYFCNDSLRLVRGLQAHIFFYPINEKGCLDCEFDWRNFDDNTPDIIVGVHYFGKYTFCENLYQASKKYGAWLVEDSAHRLPSSEDDSFYGDFVMFSLHKILPIPNGSVLVTRGNGPSTLEVDKVKGGIDSCVIKKHKGSEVRSYIWLAKRMLQKAGFGIRLDDHPFGCDKQGASSDLVEFYNISTLSKKMLRVLKFGTIDLINHRSNCQRYWSGKMLELFPGIITDDFQDAPYLAKFETQSRIKAENIFNRLRRCKVPVTSWPDLPPEVINNPERHRVAIQMRGRCFFLPVHSSISYEEIDRAICCIQSNT